MSYESIAQYIGTSSTVEFDTVSFSSISATYKHLMVIAKVSLKNATSNANTLYIKFNNTSSPGYSYVRQTHRDNVGTQSSDVYAAGAEITAIIYARPGTYGDQDYGVFTMYIPNYASTACKKTFFYQASSAVGFTSENPAGENRYTGGGGYWDSTNAITNLTFTSDSNPDFTSFTEFSLYGLKDS